MKVLGSYVRKGARWNVETTKTGIRCFQITGIIFIASFFGFGLFMEYAACISAGLLCLVLFVLLWKKEEMPVFINPTSVLISGIALFYLLTATWGVDVGMSLIGAQRFFGVLVFALLSMRLSDQQREKLLLSIPVSAGIMVVSGIAVLPFSRFRDFLWTAGRLGGFFQYPNTFALFCLLGFLIITERGSKGSRALFYQLLLLAGILLSGSRSVFFLLAVSLSVIAAVDRKQRKRLVVLFISACFTGAGYSVISGNMQNIGRFLTASFSSSTLIGRVIYAQDALKMITENPFGYGYLGYYFAVPKFQSAVYSVRFVHNDILQLALDIGILPCMLFLAVYIMNLFCGKHSFYTRIMLAAAGLHLFLDFDLEFISIWYLLILLFDLREGRKLSVSPAVMRRACFVPLLCAAAALYTGVAMVPRYLGYPAASAAALPFYTEANREILAQEKSMEKAVWLAERVLRQNDCIPEAYDIKAAAAYQNHQYGELSTNKKKSLLFQRYDPSAYKRYIALLSQAVQKAAQDGEEEETVLALLHGIMEAESILKHTEAETNPLAYKTRDVPKFELGEEAESYLQRVKRLLEE